MDRIARRLHKLRGIPYDRRAFFSDPRLFSDADRRAMQTADPELLRYEDLKAMR